MKQKTVQTIGILAVILAVVIASAVSYSRFQKLEDVSLDVKNLETTVEELKLGASNDLPDAVALFETALASSIDSSDTSFTLLSATTKAGTELASSTYAFIIDEGTASEEFVIADCTGTACTNAERGISVLDGATEVAALKKSHRRGASVKITDGPNLVILTRILNGDATIPNLITYKSGTACTAGSSSSALCDKAYYDSLANQGAATSTESGAGIVELGTAAEQAASTDNGVNSPLVLQTKYATSTPGGNNVAANHTIVADSNGFLGTGWISSALNYVFGDITATNATTTNFAVSGLSSALVKVDASGTFQEAVAGQDYLGSRYTFATTTAATATNGFASTTAFTIPANVVSASSTVSVRANLSASNVSSAVGSCTFYLRQSDGSQVFTTTGGQTINSAGYDVRGDVNVDILSDNSTTAQKILGRTFMLVDEVVNAIRASYITLVNDTGTLDFTSSVSLVGVIQSSAANVNCSINSLWIKVD